MNRTSDNPRAFVGRLASYHYVPRCLHVSAELGVADAVPENGIDIRELANAVGAHTQALHRVLRVLAAEGIFELHDATVRHNERSELLRSSHPASLHAALRWLGSDMQWQMYGELAYSVRTGRPSLESQYPGGLFEYVERRPDEGQLFSTFLDQVTPHFAQAVAASYDYSRFSRICDVGGGSGALAQQIKRAAPATQVVLFELPHVVDKVDQSVASEVEVVAGDVFRNAPPACDGYIMKNVIHDWPDEAAATILENVRRAATESVLLLAETLIGEDEGSTLEGTLAMDIGMLVLTGGRERKLSEYRELLVESGFELRAVHPTRTNLSLIEAVAA
jgi:hypothetical protein